MVATLVAAPATWGADWSEDFESLPRNASVDSWIDSRLGARAIDARGLFRTADDPLDGTNAVYGSNAADPIRLHAVRQGGLPRFGIVSTLTSPVIDGDAIVSGRFLVETSDGRFGLTMLSGLPSRDQYFLLGLAPNESGATTMRAFEWSEARGGDITDVLEGEPDSGVTVGPMRWMRFSVKVEVSAGSTAMLGRFWPDGDPEPEAWQIRVVDSHRDRLRSGRVGIWVAGRGGAWVDDLAISGTQAEDAGPPSIVILESGVPLLDDALFNRDVRPDIRITDDDPEPLVMAELDGEPWAPGSSVTVEGEHGLHITAIDRAGNRAEASVRFGIDKTPPALTLTSHPSGGLVTAALVTLQGGADDAVAIEASGRQAVIDPESGGWSLSGVALLEGTNAIEITGRDRAGNVATLRSTIVLDSRAPALLIDTPSSGACTSEHELIVEGTASDARLDAVVVEDRASGARVVASLDLATGEWRATLPVPSEGLHELVVTATDLAGHSSTGVVSVRVDRTPPTIEVTEGGASFSGAIVNRALALFVRTSDADPAVSVTSRLDGEEHSSGAIVDAEGSHTLVVTARDCAGSESSKTISFTIDLTPPTFGALTLANGVELGDLPDTITGTIDDALSDVVSVELVGTGIKATPSNKAFALSGVPFAEGTNRFTLRARDAAGNDATVDYVVTVRTEAPNVTISENGTPIASGALFNRDVTPEIVTSDSAATIAATLDGTPYSPGTVITTEGTHTLTATATNTLGRNGSKSVTFMIDKSAPTITITSPVEGASIEGDVVTVTGTATGARSVLVNGITASFTPSPEPQARSSFSAQLRLDVGENVITAVARDEAGNAARADVTVTRAGTGPAIVLLYPPDKSLTNRPRTEVVGRVISPQNVSEVEITPLPLGEGQGVRVTPNPAGDFRLPDHQLREGENAITATAIGKDGKTRSVSVSLTADFTPPSLTILAAGRPLDEGARFPDSVTLVLDATDSNELQAPSSKLLLNGAELQTPATVSAPGGHLVVATAIDAAGNTTRVERTFFVGEAGTGAGGCAVTNLDPASGSVITSTVTRLAGRTSAAAVKVNGVATEVVDGSFCTSVELPAEGANAIEIVCTTLAGEPVGEPVTLSLVRSTGQPSVTITSPAEGHVFAPSGTTATKVTVTGTADPNVVAVTVNGVLATLTPSPEPQAPSSFTADVPLAAGLNILAVRGETAAKRSAIATRRVLLLEAAPRISITSSFGSVPTGATSVDVSGTWANLDPSTLTIEGLGAGGSGLEAIRRSDTSGRFVFRSVPIMVGSNTITVNGAGGGQATSASMTVTRQDGAPSISITTPDNIITAADSIDITGMFVADPGARVEVNSVAATIPSPESQAPSPFFATVPLSTVPGAPNPIIARVIEPDGGVSVDTILVTRFAGTFDVEETFPASGAAQIPVTFQLLARLSHDVDVATVTGNVRLENAAGQPVSGILRVDRDVVTFAPSAPLAAGETYALRVTTGLRDLAGRALGTDYLATFTTEPGAPTSAPEIAALPQTFCGETLAVTGTAPAGARVRLDTTGLQFFTNASETGAFRFEVPVVGAEGYRLVRVRVVGSDGSMSVPAESCIQISCGGPQVVSATYDRTVNTLTIVFNRDIEPASVVVGSTIVLDRAGLPLSGTVAQSSATTFVVTPDEDLTRSSFRLTVTTGVTDTSANALRFPFTRSFTSGGAPVDVPPGHGYITGEVYDATTGRPLVGAMVRIAGLGAGDSGLGPRDFGLEGATNGSENISRSSGLAGRDGRGQADLRNNESVSSGRAVRTGFTDSSSGSLSAVERGGGARQGVHEGLSSPPVNRARISGGTGNAADSVLQPRLPGTGTARLAAARSRRSGQDASRFAEVAQKATSHPKSLVPSPESLTTTDARGRYALALPEGAHTIEVTAEGHTNVWRQIVVPAGTGVVPIDVRLTAHGSSAAVGSGDLTLSHGGETAVTSPVTLAIPSGSLTTGSNVTLTSVGPQSLAGLLPLGWSPLASAEVRIGDRGARGEGMLVFSVPAADIISAAQTLSAVVYDAASDQWIAIDPVVRIDPTGTASVQLVGLAPSSLDLQSSILAIALVYPDRGPGLTSPPPPTGGTTLVGVSSPLDPRSSTLEKDSFTLDPPVVLPDQRTTATLRVTSPLDPQSSTLFPSGTAVQAYIDEELQLADGSTITDPPFAADLILYRGLDGGAGEARFHLAPSRRAAEVILKVGYEHIRVHPYPGRLDRGTLIGNEGGRVPGDGTVSIEIPEGASPEPVHASVARTDVSGLTIEGYTVLGGFDFTLTRASSTAPQGLDGDGQPDPDAQVQLFKAASMSYVVDETQLPAPDSQVILAEVLTDTGYPTEIIRLTALMSDTASAAKSASQSGRSFQLRHDTDTTSSAAAKVENFGHLTADTALRYTTTLPPTALPVDGLTHEGRYVILAAKQPMAYATGLVRLGSPTGPIATNAQVSTSPLPLGEGLGVRVFGVSDLVRPTGLYAIPVPAAGFALTPSSRTSGTGTPHENPAAVATGSVQNIQLVLAPQPPVVVATTPADGATDIPVGTVIQVEISRLIDPTSVSADSITVTNALTGALLSGTTTVAGQFLSWTPSSSSELLAPSSKYTVTVAPTIRATTGAPLGTAHTFAFSTITELVSTEINRDRIRITIPDANGVSTVSGTVGAIPAGWQAVPVRRLRDFRERYQATAATDGSFTITIGNCPSPLDPQFSHLDCDTVAITDTIDLHLVNTGGILAGVIRLTPFVSPDGRSFIAPPDRETRFASDDGITVTVPMGAFDEPTLVAVTPGDPAGFGTVPNAGNELAIASTVDLDFAGIAKKRIQIEVRPSGAVDPSRQYYLGVLEQSIRGPRVMVVDTLRKTGDSYTTAPEGETPDKAALKATSLTSRAEAGTSVKESLLGAIKRGTYAMIDLQVPGGGSVTWAKIDGLQYGIDLFWDTMKSLFASQFYIEEKKGSVVVPIPADRAFEVVGVDATSGLQAFQKVYDPLAPGDPGAALPLDPPAVDKTGPYPIFGTPFRIEIVDLPGFETTIDSPLGPLKFDKGLVTIGSGDVQVPAGVPVTLLNVDRGAIDMTRDDGLKVSAKGRDRLVFYIGATEVDPSSAISIVFSEPIHLGDASTDQEIRDVLRTLVTIEKSTGTNFSTADFKAGNLTSVADLKTDSGGRRVLITLPSSLQRDSIYRIRLATTIADRNGPNGGPGLRIGQAILEDSTTSATLGEPLPLYFSVRAPGGRLGDFKLQQGSVRDLALNGNVLIVSALDAGVFAYDVADPASLSGAATPIGHIVTEDASVWAIASDHHGRIFTTSLGTTWGAVSSYRLADLVGGTGTKEVSEPRASTRVAVAPGTNVSMPLGSSELLSDRPEGIPRKLQILLQDDEEVFEGLAALTTAYPPEASIRVENDFQKLSFRFTIADGFDYRVQTITVENMTAGLSWSGDATPGVPAVIENVIVRARDRIRVIRNLRTYGVVSIFGYGIGVVDLNAVESNDLVTNDPSYRPLQEIVRLTKGAIDPSCTPGLPAYAIPDLSFAPDAGILTTPGTSTISVFGVDSRRGVLDLNITPPAKDEVPNPCGERGGATGLVVREPAVGYDHPRLTTLRNLFHAKASRFPNPRLNSVSFYRWRLEAADNKAVRAPESSNEAFVPGQRGSIAGQTVTRDYYLVPGGDYGLLVVEVGGTPLANGKSFRPLTENSLADIIWIPSGAYAVRAIPRTNLASVVDGEGRVLLVDLSRIDERYDENGKLRPDDQLFPTVTRSILVDGAAGIGSDDPRIIWQSEPGLVSGTLAPVVDADTGMIYTGQLQKDTLSVVAGTDPRIQVKVDLGDPDGLSEVGGVVPLGVELPASVRTMIASAPADRQANASLAAFRLEVSLPGAMAESLENTLQMTLRGEMLNGVPATTPLPGVPPISRTIELQRAIPSSMTSELRRQRGFNRFVSPWIVAVGDPRASDRYAWPDGTTSEQKAAAGCEVCDRPAFLAGKKESDGVYELFSAGRIIAAAPTFAGNPFAGTGYSYLGVNDRLAARISTIPSDTIRTPEVLTAAQGAPVASGAVQETIYLHSGEVATSAIDLDAGGRNGWNVIIDRSYRSRTIGGSPMGMGWESSIFRRLRALPNGDVEYRDGSGEIWRFVVGESRSGGTTTYAAPEGLFLRLARTNRGWILVDQKWRTTFFDELGRLIAEADEFRDAALEASNGNIIRYLYDTNGRLAQIIDPVGRITNLSYWTAEESNGKKTGLLRTVTDWRRRSIDYDYDGVRRLTTVALPDVPNTSNGRPTIRYTYGDVGETFNDRLELEANLTSITDPIGGKPRVSFSYEAPERDRVDREIWGTGDKVTIAYDVGGRKVTTTDALGQVREATLSVPVTGYNADRVHVIALTEKGVQVAQAEIGSLPGFTTPGVPTTKAQDRTYTFTWEKGLLKQSTLEGVRQTSTTWKSVEPQAPGAVVEQTKVEPATASAAKSASTYLGDAITTAYEYQGGQYGAAFTKAIKRNGMTINSLEPNRTHVRQEKWRETNSAIETITEFNEAGQPTLVRSTGGTDVVGAGSELKIGYAGVTSSTFERGLPKVIESGDLKTTIDYDENTVVETDPRGIQTVTTLDAWRRPIRVTVSGTGVNVEETYAYDANGRLERMTRRQGEWTVTTSYTYDILGRMKTSTTDSVEVGGAPQSLTTSWTYDLAGRTVTTTLPSGAVTTTTIDSLGRAVHTKTKTNTDRSNPIDDYYAYDIDDNVVFATDTLTATATAFDIHGRPRAIRYPDGTSSVTVYDDFGRVRQARTYDAGGVTTSEASLSLTDAGRITGVETKINEETTRSTRFGWDGGGRTTGAVTGSRAVRSRFDVTGRILSRQAGEGSLEGLTDVFSRTTIDPSGYHGTLPTSVQTVEKGATYNLGFGYDNVGNSTSQRVGNLEWRSSFDEAGNVLTSQLPNRPAATYEYDGRGALTSETKPDGAVVTYTHDALGAPTGYIDPTNEATTTTTDLIGRPKLRVYPDGTTESWTYEGRRLESYTDRQGRHRSIDYNDKGQVVRILGSNNVVLERIDHDDAGRVIRRRNKDAAVEYDDFDLAGRPRTTRQIRYADGTGVIDSPTVIDSYEQQHTWNEHGERTGFTLPSYPGMSPGEGWTKSLTEERDAMGNVATIARTIWGSDTPATLMAATFRNAGRPDLRTITTAPIASSSSELQAPSSISRYYGYDPNTGQLDAMRVASEGLEVVGSVVTYDGIQRAEAVLVGLSGGERSNQWSYDARGRLATSAQAKKTDAAKSIESLTPSDFRESLERPETTPASPKSLNFTESTAGHKIEAVEKGEVTRDLAWDGSEMVDDGTFVYQFDTYGRLVMVTEKVTSGPSSLSVRRIRYTYTPTNRLVGRRAEYARLAGPGIEPDETDWRLEDRADILAADALPADTTFVWNPFADTIDAVFVAGSSERAGLPNGGLVRQIIHGGLSYDDPIEVTAVDPNSTGGALTRLYPIYDEAGAGMLQAILNTSGEMVARTFADGAYGEDEYALPGPAVDRIAVSASKDNTGALTEVKISLRLTEQIDETTLGNGLRLAALAADGSVLRTSDAPPSLTDNWTAGWKLTAGEWSALIDGASSISIAATNTLRAARWADTPVLAVPDWATSSKPVFSSTALPVEARESVATLGEWITSISANTETTVAIYEVPDLAAIAGSQDVAGDPRKLLVAATFHAHPFHESLTGKNYVRARWYAPELGNFISPDPAGYRDSSNLYAFAGGDPVNRRDPTGKCWNPFDERCRQDAKWIAEEFVSLTITDQDAADRNAEHIVGGVIGIKNIAVGVGELAQDLTYKNYTDSTGAGDRNLARLQGAKEFFSHPIKAHSETADRIISLEQQGMYAEAGARASEMGAGDAALAIGAGQVAVAAASLPGRIVAARLAAALAEEDAYSAAWFASNPLLESGFAEVAGGVSESAAVSAGRVTFATGREWYDYLAGKYGTENVDWVHGSGRTISNWPSELPQPTGRMFRVESPPRSSSFVRELTEAAGPRPPDAIAHHVKFLMLGGVDDGAVNGAWVNSTAHTAGHRVLKWTERLSLGTEVVIRE